MKPKQAIAEANGILRQLAGGETAVRRVYSVVEVASALDLNINTVRAHVRGRPFGVKLSGRTAKGHRGFKFFDVLTLRMGRYAMEYGVHPAQVQTMVDGLRSRLQPAVAGGQEALVIVSNSDFELLSAADCANEEKVRAFVAVARSGGIRFHLDEEIVETVERLAAILEHRPYHEPVIVQEARQCRAESFKRSLMDTGKMTRSVRRFISDAVLAGGLPPYRQALVGLMSQSLNDSTVAKLIGIIEAKFIDRLPKDRRDGSLYFVNVNHDEPECLFVPYGTNPGYLSQSSQVFALPWGFILDAVDASAKGLLESAQPEPIKRM